MKTVYVSYNKEYERYDIWETRKDASKGIKNSSNEKNCLTFMYIEEDIEGIIKYILGIKPSKTKVIKVTIKEGR